MSLFSQRSSSSKYKGASSSSTTSSTCRSFPPSGGKGGHHPPPSNRLNLHSKKSSSTGKKSQSVTVHSPRLSLPPPDIVLLVEDQESHEIRNVTLLSCDEARKAVYREQQRRESNLSGADSKRGSRANSTSNCNIILGFTPTEMRCYKCRKQIVTSTSKSLTTTGLTSSIVICIVCPFLAICVIPLIIKSHHRVIHKCPICASRLGTSISPSIASSTCTPSNSSSQGPQILNQTAAIQIAS